MKNNLWIILVVIITVLILVLTGCYVGCDLKKLRLVKLSIESVEKQIMITKLYGPNSFKSTTIGAPRSASNQETAKVFKLSNEIKQINKETDYIKKYGELPPKTPNFYKRLNVI
ncbi:MAG: hypothetical protein ACO20H_03315 [Bacteriovoracaceae bacterium]